MADIAPCPICGAPYGFHDDEPHDVVSVPLHLLRSSKSALRDRRPKQTRPSDEEIAALRAAKQARKAASAVLLALLLLVGCGDPVTQGVVLERKHTPAKNHLHEDAVYRQQCLPQTRTSSRYVNGQYQTYPETYIDCQQVFSHYDRYDHYHPDEWELRLHDEKRDKKGWLTVTKEEYERSAVGVSWPEPR